MHHISFPISRAFYHYDNFNYSYIFTKVSVGPTTPEVTDAQFET